MSIYSASNSAAPSLVGYIALLGGTLSAGSLLVGGNAIIDLPGNGVVDFAASAATAVIGGAILKSRDATAAWLGVGLIAMGLTYAGWNVDTDQAGRMLTAAKNAATAGATAAAATTTASSHGLTAAQAAWCNQDDNGDGKLNRYESVKAVRNCNGVDL